LALFANIAVGALVLLVVSTTGTAASGSAAWIMADQDRVFAKCAWRLIPFMGLLYLVNQLDRVNVGFAALTMNKDLGFTPTIYGFGAGVFFFHY
jgi:hypothetical protein